MLFTALPQLGKIDQLLYKGSYILEDYFLHLGQDSSQIAKHIFYWFNIEGGYITFIKGLLLPLISMCNLASGLIINHICSVAF